MGNFSLILSRGAVRDLDRFEDRIAEKILKAAEVLKENPFPRGKLIKKIKGTKSDFYRLRVGDYRIFYYIELRNIVILKIISRKDADKFIKNL